MSNRTWMLIFGILCIALSGVLFYGVTRREYYFRIDTVDMVESLTGWNPVVSIAGAVALAFIVFAIGVLLIGLRPRS